MRVGRAYRRKVHGFVKDRAKSEAIRSVDFNSYNEVDGLFEQKIDFKIGFILLQPKQMVGEIVESDWKSWVGMLI